jgi:hypothetical protein
MPDGVAYDRPETLIVESQRTRFSIRPLHPGGCNVVIPAGGFLVTIPFQVIAVEGQPLKATPGQASYEPFPNQPSAPAVDPRTEAEAKRIQQEKSHAAQSKGVSGGEHQGVPPRPDLRPNQEEVRRKEGQRPSDSGG